MEVVEKDRALEDALAEAIDAIVDNISPRLRTVLQARLLGSRWPWDRSELPQALQDAKRAVGKALRRREVL